MGKKRINPKAASTATSKMQLASEVAQRVEIEDIRLIETHAVQRLRDARLPSRLEISIQTESCSDEEDSRIKVDVRAQIRAQYDDEDPTEIAPLEISALFRLTYLIAFTSELTKEHIAAFGELNGVYNAWPYWREYVQSTTVRMGLPPLAVPVYRPHEHSGKAARRGCD